MAINLKPYYDSALEAGQNVERIMAEMDSAFQDGTEEGKEKALSLRGDLEAAKEKAKGANDLYISLRDAGYTSDSVARNFVPVPEGEPETDAEKKQRTRAEYAAMSAREQMDFIKAGGVVVD